jgi:hypothetical protein
MSVHKKLMDARLAMQDTPLKKSGHNTYSGYDYFKLGDFLNEAQRIFRDLGLCGIVRFKADEATLEIVDTDKPDGERITITSPMGSAALKGCHEVQNIGAVESYQRRYLWMAAYEIVEDYGLDATTGKPAGKREANKVRPTDGAWEAMDEEAQAWLTRLAGEVEQIFKAASPADAADHLLAQNLDTEELAAIWTRFPSVVRSGLKKAGKEKK